MTDHDLGERIAALEVEVRNTNKNLETNLEQLRKMHQQHYDAEKKTGEQMVEVFGIAESAKRHIDGHIENHWKWFTWVVGTFLTLGGLALAIFEHFSKSPK